MYSPNQGENIVAMFRQVVGFLPFPKALSFARQTRPSSTTTSTMCSLHRVTDLAQKAIRRAGISPKLPPWVPFSASASPHPALSNAELDDLKSIVRSMDVADLAVFRDDFVNPVARDSRRRFIDHQLDAGAIAYISVCERSDVTMAIFVLPPGSSIPIHDHTHMCVVSRVLWGVLDVVSFDLLPQESSAMPNTRLGSFLPARRRADSVLREGEIAALTPHAGNVHSFQAREWTAVFDVLVPPYSEAAGRNCNFYREARRSSEDNIFLQVSFQPTALHDFFPLFLFIFLFLLTDKLLVLRLYLESFLS